MAKRLLAPWMQQFQRHEKRSGLGASASLCPRTPPSLNCERRAAKSRDLACNLKWQKITGWSVKLTASLILWHLLACFKLAPHCLVSKLYQKFLTSRISSLCCVSLLGASELSGAEQPRENNRHESMRVRQRVHGRET